jgi:hypothetical protein
MSKDDIIDLLIRASPQIREAYNWEEEVKQRVYAEELYATMDELYASRRAAGILEEAVEQGAEAFLKAIEREVHAYDRSRIS